jgi:uncharacterized membrane protein YqjE
VRALIGRLVPTILQHLDAYADVAVEDAREATAWVARRLLALLVAGACAFVSLIMLCAWILVLAWETPWRAWVAGGLALVFAAAAVALAWPALKRRPAANALFFPRVRGEFRRDRELMERAFNNGRDGNGRDGRGKAGNGDESRAG